MQYEIKVTEISPPACYSPTEYTGSEGAPGKCQAVYNRNALDFCCLQCEFEPQNWRKSHPRGWRWFE